MQELESTFRFNVRSRESKGNNHIAPAPKATLIDNDNDEEPRPPTRCRQRSGCDGKKLTLCHRALGYTNRGDQPMRDDLLRAGSQGRRILHGDRLTDDALSEDQSSATLANDASVANNNVDAFGPERASNM